VLDVGGLSLDLRTREVLLVRAIESAVGA